MTSSRNELNDGLTHFSRVTLSIESIEDSIGKSLVQEINVFTLTCGFNTIELRIPTPWFERLLLFPTHLARDPKQWQVKAINNTSYIEYLFFQLASQSSVWAFTVHQSLERISRSSTISVPLISTFHLFSVLRRSWGGLPVYSLHCDAIACTGFSQTFNYHPSHQLTEGPTIHCCLFWLWKKPYYTKKHYLQLKFLHNIHMCNFNHR